MDGVLIDQRLAEAEPIIKSIAKRTCGRIAGIEFDDFCQLLRIEAWRLAESFDPSIGTWTGFAFKTLKWRAIDLLRTHGKKKRNGEIKVEFNQVSLNEVLDFGISFDPVDESPEVSSDIEWREIEAACMGDGTTRAMVLYARGLNQREIASEMSLGESRVSQLLNKHSTNKLAARMKLLKLFFGGYEVLGTQSERKPA